MSVGILLKLGSYNSSRCTYFILNCTYLVRASLNSLYIHLSVIPKVEISGAVKWALLSYKHPTYNRENELSAAALNGTVTVLELRRSYNFFFKGSHLWQSAETKFNTARKDSIEKNFIYLKRLAYNYCHSHKWRVEWIPSSANSSFERLHIVVFLSTSGAKENALTASHQRLNPVFIRSTQRGFPHKNIENTFWVIQSACRSLEMHSKRCFKICICSVIRLGELSLFKITRALVSFLQKL